MGKILKASPQELDALFALSASIPESYIDNARKYANFRRAIKIALKPYADGIEAFLSILREDAKKFMTQAEEKDAELKDAKKADKKKIEDELANIRKAIDDIEKDYQDRLKKYQEENKSPISVTLNEEDAHYITELFSKSAKDLFKVKVSEDKTIYDAVRADALFDLLDTIS